MSDLVLMYIIALFLNEKQIIFIPGRKMIQGIICINKYPLTNEEERKPELNLSIINNPMIRETSDINSQTENVINQCF